MPIPRNIYFEFTNKPEDLEKGHLTINFSASTVTYTRLDERGRLEFSCPDNPEAMAQEFLQDIQTIFSAKVKDSSQVISFSKNERKNWFSLQVDGNMLVESFMQLLQSHIVSPGKLTVLTATLCGVAAFEIVAKTMSELYNQVQMYNAEIRIKTMELPGEYEYLSLAEQAEVQSARQKMRPG